MAWISDVFLLVWSTEHLDYATDLSSWDRDVYARLYESDGTPATGELRLNDIVSGNQALGRGSTSVLCDSGDFVTFWHGPRPGTEQHRLYGRHFHADGTPKGPERVIGSDVGSEAGLWLSAQVAGDGDCQRFAAVGRIPPHHILVARMNASLDLIGAEPW